MKKVKVAVITLFILVLTISGNLAQAQRCYPDLPAPKLKITEAQDYAVASNAYTGFRMTVSNWKDFPNQLFKSSPDLPACGLNTNASRTWVNIFTKDDMRLYGFCALSKSKNLKDLWFARPRGEPPSDCVYITLNDRRCGRTYKSNCASTKGFGPACIGMEDSPLGTSYDVADVFVDSGATITVEPFQWSNGIWTSGGHANIANGGDAGGSGQEIWVNNVNLDFKFPVKPNTLFLRFGEYGGNLNIEINNDFFNFANFVNINGMTLGGVKIKVTNGHGGDKGTLMLTGEINSFSIGGQELVIDQICIKEMPPVDATGVWIMPYGIGGTRLDKIQADGLTDYTDSISGYFMNDAPFGGRLGLRLGKSNTLPTADMTYYRFLYKHESETNWKEFKEPVSVHYMKEAPGSTPVFPLYQLGPHDVSGKMLYRFQPHEADLPGLVPVAAGESVSWPHTGFIGDIYRGFLNTQALHLSPGRYQVKLEVFNSTGAQTLPGAGTFQFIVPTGTLADGTIVTAPAAAGSIDAGGFVFTVHVDNRLTSAVIDEPTLGTASAGNCGFLRYNPAWPVHIPPVRVNFRAAHPDNFALFSFRIWRGPNPVSLATIIREEVSATNAGTAGIFGPYIGDGNGNFKRNFSRTELLGKCIEAAFSENLHVYSKATNGWHHRLNRLDSNAVRAFALTPN